MTPFQEEQTTGPRPEFEMESIASPPDPSDPTSGTTSTPKSNRRKKWFLLAVKLFVTFLIFFFIFRELQKSSAAIQDYHWDLRPGWLVFSGLLYLTAFFPAALFWFLALRWMGQSPTFFQGIRSYYFSQLGKYIPGKAMVVVIRSAMVTGEKVKPGIAAVCVFYETLTMMAVGAFLSALILLIWFSEHWRYSLLALGTMVAAGLPLLPPIFPRILHLLRIGRNDPLVQDYLKKMTWRSLGVGFGLMTLLWIGFGLFLWSAIRGLGVVTGPLLPDLPRYVSVMALAIVLGFAVPISPGGLGIREAVLAILLIPFFETLLALPENQSIPLDAKSLALVVSLEQRIVNIVAEVGIVAVFSLVGFVRRFTTRSTVNQTVNRR